MVHTFNPSTREEYREETALTHSHILRFLKAGSSFRTEVEESVAGCFALFCFVLFWLGLGWFVFLGFFCFCFCFCFLRQGFFVALEPVLSLID